jgi:hypothetical protein
MSCITTASPTVTSAATLLFLLLSAIAQESAPVIKTAARCSPIFLGWVLNQGTWGKTTNVKINPAISASTPRANDLLLLLLSAIAQEIPAVNKTATRYSPPLLGCVLNDGICGSTKNVIVRPRTSINPPAISW